MAWRLRKKWRIGQKTGKKGNGYGPVMKHGLTHPGGGGIPWYFLGVFPLRGKDHHNGRSG
jgi:hypothetical protein